LRVVDGNVPERMRIHLMNTGGTYDVEDMGSSLPSRSPRDEMSVGEVGFIVANIKKISDCQIGDTVTEDKNRTLEPFPGFREVKPMVFAGLYPTDAAQYEDLRDAMEKLRLNDSSFNYEPESSGALGFGFGAASSACSTWRSCRSVSSASTSWSSSRRRPACRTA
jgi:GTP-binding protein LepA